MPNHIRFLFRHAIYGAVAACVFVALLMYFNVANLWHLVTHSPSGFLALGVMTAFFIITFSSVQIGIAVMGLQERDDSDTSGGSGVAADAFALAHTGERVTEPPQP